MYNTTLDAKRTNICVWCRYIQCTVFFFSLPHSCVCLNIFNRLLFYRAFWTHKKATHTDGLMPFVFSHRFRNPILRWYIHRRKKIRSQLFLSFPIFFVVVVVASHVLHVSDVALYLCSRMYHNLGLYERGHLHIILNILLTTYIHWWVASCCGNNVTSRSGPDSNNNNKKEANILCTVYYDIGY